MLLAHDPSRHALMPVAELPEAGWVHVRDPTAAELELLRRRGVPAGLLVHALDPDEIARVDHGRSATLFVLRVPVHQSDAREPPYVSTALGVVFLDRLVLTLARRESDLLADLQGIEPRAAAHPYRLVAQLAMRTADRFLVHLRTVDRTVNELERRLGASLANVEVLELLRYQKALVHFTTALASDQIMIERVARDPQLSLTPDDHELFEDALVELRQASEMTAVSADILAQMMDAFASIISNNLNVVMKVLTALTVILTGPVLLVSLYGMNVRLPWAGHPLIFVGIVLLCLVLSAAVAAWFRHRRWL